MATAPQRSPAHWTRLTQKGPEYIEPAYYEYLLKPYVFDDRDDIELFQEFVQSAALPAAASCLEIGPGTGRATRVISEIGKTVKIDFVDQSARMLDFLVRHLPQNTPARFFRSDALSWILQAEDSYDLIFSLWSLSHSIHQNIAREGEHLGSARARAGLRRLFGTLLKQRGTFFIMHFDSTSDEQTISVRQRRRRDKWLSIGSPSPSQTIIESILSDESASGNIRYEKQRLAGRPIIFSNMEEALEVYMNFHMEGMFNNSPEYSGVIAGLVRDLNEHRLLDGRVAVIPSCLVYKGTRL